MGDNSDSFWNEMGDDDVDDKPKASNWGTKVSGYLKTVTSFYGPATVYGSIPHDKEEDYGFATSDEAVEREVIGLYRRLRMLAVVVAPISLFFWVWALKNTSEMSDGQDLGIYSFLTTLISSHWILYKTRSGPKVGYEFATVLARLLVSTSHLLVCVNYALGLVYALTVGNSVYPIFATYCAVFCILWGGVAIFGFSLMHKIHDGELNMQRLADDDYDIDGAEDYF